MRTLAIAALSLALAGPAAAACPTVTDLEDELVCPTCKVTLDQSDAPVANQMRAYIRRRVAACASKEQIKAELVADFGRRVLASPPKEGFDLIAWLLPIGGVLLAAGAVGVLAWRWSRTREPAAAADTGEGSTNGRVPVGPDLERRLDEELARFDG